MPLSATMLTSLREFWKTHRHPKPGLSSRGSRLARTGDATFGWSRPSDEHFHPAPFRLARAAAGIKDRGEVPHPASQLRDSPDLRRSEPVHTRSFLSRSGEDMADLSLLFSQSAGGNSISASYAM